MEVQSAGKGACLSGNLSVWSYPLIYTLDARLILYDFYIFFVENHLLGNTKLSFLVLRVTGLAGKVHLSLFLHSLLKITY